ncbi:MAG: hypothetical protein R6U84_10705 [Candidatus Cloacimonadales bacterium]
MVEFFTVLGTWLGAFFTFAIFSFLYKDNPVYKIAEQVFVGLSAGYWFVYTIYNVLKPNLWNPLTSDFSNNLILLIPTVLGIMMLMRLISKIDWVSRYPIAILIATTAGISFLRFLKSDVIGQLRATMINPFAGDNWVIIFGQILLVIGTITGVIYFYFSKKHEGAFGVSAKVGIYFLMVSFGAAFGYTAMARISLLIGRLQFLLGDWLHWIK